MLSGLRKKNTRGFTLIELLIVIAIIGIIASFAYSSYSRSIEKSRRTDAKDALTHAAALQERQYLQRNQYSGTLALVGGATSENAYYAITVTNALNGTACADWTCYTMTATAQGVQLGDTACATFSIDSLGRKTATNDFCW